MGYLLTFFSGLFAYFAPFLGATVTRAAISLGFGTVVYQGVGFIFDTVIAQVNSSMGDLPYILVQFVHLLGIDTAINIGLSAGFALMVLKGMSSNMSLRKQVWRKGGDNSTSEW
ncbi:DUF2523 family protein [Vibrio sp. 10N.261.46.A3]|uniref:DUF2523 family protein n=1 Tax=Vibrio sp. 10N.261.46.A3 TaxID=3229658 RepID=UPI003552F306